MCLNVKLLLVLNAIGGHDVTLMCCSNTLTVMAMTAVRLYSLHLWNNGAVLLGPARPDGVFALMCLNLQLL